MKFQTTFFLIVFFQFCLAQTVIQKEEISMDKFSKNECYILSSHDTKEAKKQHVILEIQAPRFQTIDTDISAQNLIENGTPSDSSFYELIPTHSSLKFREIAPPSRQSISDMTLHQFMVCFSEVPESIHKKNSGHVLAFQPIINKEITKKTRLFIKILDKKPEHLQSNQRYLCLKSDDYFFSKWLISTCHSSPSIAAIKKSLILKGYWLETNNKLDEATKAALRDFQQKNGLTIGNIDLETIRALGINY